MARRGGKAASRRSRQQRRAQRAQQQAGQQPRAEPQAGPGPDAAAAPAGEQLEATAPSTPVDAFEAADAELRASTPPPGTRAGAPRQQRSVRARTGNFTMAGGSSRLTERAAAEYHYVGRDLRNIGILLVVMVVLLAISAIVVNLLGVGI